MQHTNTAKFQTTDIRISNDTIAANQNKEKLQQQLWCIGILLRFVPLFMMMSVVLFFVVLVCCIVFNRECVGCKLHFKQGRAVPTENQWGEMTLWLKLSSSDGNCYNNYSIPLPHFGPFFTWEEYNKGYHFAFFFVGKVLMHHDSEGCLESALDGCSYWLLE